MTPIAWLSATAVLCLVVTLGRAGAPLIDGRMAEAAAIHCAESSGYFTLGTFALPKLIADTQFTGHAVRAFTLLISYDGRSETALLLAVAPGPNALHKMRFTGYQKDSTCTMPDSTELGCWNAADTTLPRLDEVTACFRSVMGYIG